MGIAIDGEKLTEQGFISVKNPTSARRRKKKKRQRVIHRNDVSLQQVKQWLLTAKGVLSTVLRLH
jgi:hypothetical protein